LLQHNIPNQSMHTSAAAARYRAGRQVCTWLVASMMHWHPAAFMNAAHIHTGLCTAFSLQNWHQ